MFQKKVAIFAYKGSIKVLFSLSLYLGTIKLKKYHKGVFIMYQGERFNSISHLIGAIAALVGMIILVVLASLKGDPWKIVSFSIYGVTLFSLYLASTLYHSLRGRAKEIFQQINYYAIYLLIAGSYTPFTLVTLNGPWGWSLFGSIWLLAAIGIFQEVIMRKGRSIFSVIIYIIMGWLIIIALGPLREGLTPNGFYFLLLGGLFYSFGVIFYAFDAKVRHFHGIWHLFVLAGSATHYFTVVYYVL